MTLLMPAPSPTSPALRSEKVQPWHHDRLAGVYVYGRRQEDPRRRRPGQPRSGGVVVAPEAWLAFLPDHAPASIPWEQSEANLAQLAANRARAESRGAMRAGRALLAGLIGRYDGTPAGPAYVCARRATDYGAPHCQPVPASGLDAFVGRQVLAALEPAALELSLTATERLEQERAERGQLWQQRPPRTGGLRGGASPPPV